MHNLERDRRGAQPGAENSIAARLMESRRQSLKLAEPLSDEDQMVQAMDDASPTKWHLGHTTWFYEAFVLKSHLAGYEPYSDRFEYCFNSYYESKGDRHPRAFRGLLTRPSGAEVRDYRAYVDEHLDRLLNTGIADDPAFSRLIELGINHEQQHQELLLTDILCLFANQPLQPAYAAMPLRSIERDEGGDATYLEYDGGIREIGHAGDGFSYDNEGPRHEVLVHPFSLADRCVTNREFVEFVESGAYANPLVWLADGWATVKDKGWQAPEYWEKREGTWHQMTLHGLVPLDPSAPVVHTSYYEAEAFARWAGKRLPTEFEWEVAAAGVSTDGNTIGTGALRPLPARPASQTDAPAPRQMFGDVWEWTQSAYLPYRGYKPPEGAIGEYNGKFMCSQQVLRGASCATADGHSRRTYRNFFYPGQRWQFMGFRLAEDA